MSGLILAVAAGAAIGVAIGYFLNSDEKDELVSNVKDKAARFRDKASEVKDKIKEKMHHVNDPIDEVAG